MSRILVDKIVASDCVETQQMFVKKGAVYTFLNPVSYLAALKNENLFVGFDGIMVDGTILAVAIGLLYGKKIRRRSFDMTSIVTLLFRHSISRKKTIYLIGATLNQIERSVEILQRQFPELRIVGYRDGYFSSEDEMRETCKSVVTLAPDYVIAGMGTILQEKFLLRLKDYGYKGIGFTCGGFITQLSMKGIVYYPSWADKCNLRFLYRFYKEKHTRKRYLKAVFLFPFYFIWGKLK
jgi:glycosyltransferase family 26